MQKHKEYIEKMFSKQENMEENFVKQREFTEDKYLLEIRKLKQAKYREYFDLKLALEKEIENHQKCFEDMEAIYNLNSEKLNYNYKVLSEKNKENISLAESLKKEERNYINLLKNKNDEFMMKGKFYKILNSNKLIKN